MSDSITISGFVATPPRHVVTGTGLKITSFRLASNQRRFDRQENRWVDGDTNWYTISTFRHLAENVYASIKKGERVLVAGRVKVRDWTDEQKSGTTIEVEADALGHDLAWGQATFARRLIEASREDAAAEEQQPGSDEFPSAEPQESDQSERLEPLAAATPF